MPLLEKKDRNYAMHELRPVIELTQLQAKQNSAKLKEGVLAAREQIDSLLAQTQLLTKVHPDEKIKKANLAAWDMCQEEYPDFVQHTVETNKLLFNRTQSVSSAMRMSHGQVAKGPMGPPPHAVEFNDKLIKRGHLLQERTRTFQEKLERKMQQSEEHISHMHKLMYQKKRIQGWIIMMFLGKTILGMLNKLKSNCCVTSCQTAAVEGR